MEYRRCADRPRSPRVNKPERRPWAAGAGESAGGASGDGRRASGAARIPRRRQRRMCIPRPDRTGGLWRQSLRDGRGRDGGQGRRTQHAGEVARQRLWARRHRLYPVRARVGVVVVLGGGVMRSVPCGLLGVHHTMHDRRDGASHRENGEEGEREDGAEAGHGRKIGAAGCRLALWESVWKPSAPCQRPLAGGNPCCFTWCNNYRDARIHPLRAVVPRSHSTHRSYDVLPPRPRSGRPRARPRGLRYRSRRARAPRRRRRGRRSAFRDPGGHLRARHRPLLDRLPRPPPRHLQRRRLLPGLRRHRDGPRVGPGGHDGEPDRSGRLHRDRQREAQRPPPVAGLLRRR